MNDTQSGSRSRLRLEHVTKRFHDTSVVRDISLEVRAGEFLTLLGPSGCGKTTLIRMIAGYIDPSGGRIVQEDRDVTHLPPQRRNMGMVFQDYALFDHLTVRDNVAFGPRVRGAKKAESRAKAGEMLELVGLRASAGKYPAQLSGGMRQRVALARALAIQPDVLLLDEPFSALDAKLRVSLRDEVRRVQKATGVTTILVTHDQEEAFSVSDRVVVMREGTIEQVGGPRDLYSRPRTPFVLEFVGRSSRVKGRVEACGEGKARLAIGTAKVTATGDEVLSQGEDVTVAIRPESVQLFAVDAASSHENSYRGVVRRTEFVGSHELADVEVPSLGMEICVESSSADRGTRWRVDDAVSVRFSADDVILIRLSEAGAAVLEKEY